MIGDNDILFLETDIFGPLDELHKISFELDILAFKIWVGNTHKANRIDGKVGLRLRDEPRMIGSFNVWGVC